MLIISKLYLWQNICNVLQNMEDNTDGEHITYRGISLRLIHEIRDFRCDKARSTALREDIRLFICIRTETEIYNLQNLLIADSSKKQVLRLNITMHDILLCAVRNTVDEHVNDLSHFFFLIWILRMLLDFIVERSAFDDFHDKVECVFTFKDLMQLDHIRVSA